VLNLCQREFTNSKKPLSRRYLRVICYLLKPRHNTEKNFLKKIEMKTSHTSSKVIHYLISKGLTNLSRCKRKFLPIVIVQVLKVDKNTLSSFRTHVTETQKRSNLITKLRKESGSEMIIT